MYEHMVHPILTVLFDLFIIGSALTIGSAMVAEYLVAREPRVGTSRRYQPKYQAPAPSRKRATIHRMPSQPRRAA